ncbi:MAG: ABC transporter permease subunit [Anaerolineae bacterium]
MDKILTIIDKEWAEVFKNRLVLFTVVLLPLVFTILPLVILSTMGSAGPSGAVGDMPPEFTRMCGDVRGAACIQIFIIYEFMMLFMILPLAIPVAISAYSIVGEKTTRSLEPLLATPITTAELILGKGLAAAIPAIVATWVGFVVFVLGTRVLVPNPQVSSRLLDPVWLIAVIVVGPLLAAAAVNMSIIVSSRVSDPRTAEQLAMVLIVPVLGVFFGQIAGLILVDAGFMLTVVAVMLLVDAALVYLGVGLFQRETILTKWR